jgi:hypothetical protein
MLKLILNSKIKRQDENIFVFKGVDNFDLTGEYCKVNGEILVSVN